MEFVQNFPFFCIILSMFSAIISFVMNGRIAKYIHVAMVTAVLILSLATLSFVAGTGESYTFMMGHFPAPWGNEIRIGELEALMAVFFSLIMMLSIFGGMAHIDREVQDSKKNLFYILLDLLMASLLALIYTNDLFRDQYNCSLWSDYDQKTGQNLCIGTEIYDHESCGIRAVPDRPDITLQYYRTSPDVSCQSSTGTDYCRAQLSSAVDGHYHSGNSGPWN